MTSTIGMCEEHTGWVQHAITGMALAIVISLMLQTHVRSQSRQEGAIVGVVIDAETARPLENVILFIPHSSFAQSSGSDGRFRIRDIPEGAYELIVTRVGYERRVMSVRVPALDSLSLQINLHLQPIRQGEMEIVGELPLDTRIESRGVFFPKEVPGAYCLFGTFNSMPIGILFSDSAFYMYALDTAIVDSEPHVRLWLLYQNLSEAPCLLDPEKTVMMNAIGMTGSSFEIRPASYVQIHARIDSVLLMSRLCETIEKPLRSMAVTRTKFLREFERFQNNSKARERRTPTNQDLSLDAPPANDGTLSPTLFRVFSSSVSAGLLRRCRVYPNASVNGFIYFPIPLSQAQRGKTKTSRAFEFLYRIIINTPSGNRIITFIPG